MWCHALLGRQPNLNSSLCKGQIIRLSPSSQKRRALYSQNLHSKSTSLACVLWQPLRWGKTSFVQVFKGTMAVCPEYRLDTPHSSGVANPYGLWDWVGMALCMGLESRSCTFPLGMPVSRKAYKFITRVTLKRTFTHQDGKCEIWYHEICTCSNCTSNFTQSFPSVVLVKSFASSPSERNV